MLHSKVDVLLFEEAATQQQCVACLGSEIETVGLGVVSKGSGICWWRQVPRPVCLAGHEDCRFYTECNRKPQKGNMQEIRYNYFSKSKLFEMF